MKNRNTQEFYNNVEETLLKIGNDMFDKRKAKRKSG